MDEKTTTASPTSSPISVTDLSLQDLLALKKQVDAALTVDVPELGNSDVILEYTVRIRTKDGVVANNTGAVRMNALTSPRLLAEAPRRFETEFRQNVYAPVSAGLYDLLDKYNPTDESTTALRASSEGADPIGFGLSFPGSL